MWHIVRVRLNRPDPRDPEVLLAVVFCHLVMTEVTVLEFAPNGSGPVNLIPRSVLDRIAEAISQDFDGIGKHKRLIRDDEEDRLFVVHSSTRGAFGWECFRTSNLVRLVQTTDVFPAKALEQAPRVRVDPEKILSMLHDWKMQGW